MKYRSILTSFLILVVPVAAQTARPELNNGKLRVIAEKRGDSYSERYYARDAKGWTAILAGESKLKRNGAVLSVSFQYAEVVVRGEDTVLVIKGEAGRETITREIRLEKNESIAHVDVVYESPDSIHLQYVLSNHSFVAGKKPDFVFTPQLRPEADEIIGDHTFRSPAFMMQAGPRFGAIVPDLATIDGEKRPIRAAADVQVDAPEFPQISFGLMNWQKKGHVYYSYHDSLAARLPAGKVGFGYFVFASATAKPKCGYQEVVRFHWRRYGHMNLLQAKGPQSEPFSSYIQKAWHQYVPQVASEVVYQGKPVALLSQQRLAWSNKLHKAADNDNWFNVWFNSLRTAYGMHIYARESDDPALKRLAEGNLNLALLAPQREGIAPSIFYHDSTGGHWVADHAWGGIDEGKSYAMFHNAWTNYWLLEWSQLLPERKNEIMTYVKSFADFLVRQQKPSGVIPSWYDAETLEPAAAFRDENAETAGAAFFLAEFYRRSNERRYLRAAEKAMQYVFREVVPENKWFDYETFFSCSRKPLGFYDRYTHQHPQNTLSMHQAAEACLTLYQMTGKAEYKERGIEIMDYLCLYQQVWSPRWLSCELLGGFGVQNTDGEWSDSRQGYFAVTLGKYYELTGKREYLERGVAALRAMFSLFESAESPRTAENYAHASYDQLAGVTGLHWGTGSSVVSIHLMRQQYGDAYVNVREQWGVGIDGCRIPAVRLSGDAIHVTLLDNLSSPRSLRVKFDRIKNKRYTLVINEATRGTFSAEELRKGIDVAI
jgi:hypothetical protein